jgi:hypothetical protein
MWILSWNYFFYGLYKVVMFVFRGESISPLHLTYFLLPGISYAILKYSLFGVPAESLGAKGALPSIVRFVSTLLGQSGSISQTIGVWIGTISMALSFVFGFILLGDLVSGKISREEFHFQAIWVGLLCVGGFITAHLAQTGWLFPVTVMSVGGEVVTSYMPLYVVSVSLCLLSLLFLLKYLMSRG